MPLCHSCVGAHRASRHRLSNAKRHFFCKPISCHTSTHGPNLYHHSPLEPKQTSLWQAHDMNKRRTCPSHTTNHPLPLATPPHPCTSAPCTCCASSQTANHTSNLQCITASLRPELPSCCPRLPTLNQLQLPILPCASHCSYYYHTDLPCGCLHLKDTESTACRTCCCPTYHAASTAHPTAATAYHSTSSFRPAFAAASSSKHMTNHPPHPAAAARMPRCSYNT